MKIERFEDIESWQKARELTKEIYKITRKGAFARDYELKGQIRKASVSIMSNIAEGFEREGNAEFRRFLRIAKGSAGEVRSQLYVALDGEIITKALFDELCALATDTSKLVSGFIRYLNKIVKARK